MDYRKEIRMQDIARELNISIVSVSNALNGKKGVGEELRQKVRDKAEELGYIPHRKKQNQEKETGGYCIGIAMAERWKEGISSFYMNIYKEIVRCISEHDGLTVLEYAKTMGCGFKGVDIDGIIFLGEAGMDFIHHAQSGRNVPAVGIDFYGPDDLMDYVVPDYFHETQRIIQQLIDAGYKEIAFTKDPYESGKMLDCYMGYCNVLQINGIRECITGNKETDAGLLTGCQLYSRGMERILARNGVDLLMKRLGGESGGYGIRMVACHA